MSQKKQTLDIVENSLTPYLRDGIKTPKMSKKEGYEILYKNGWFGKKGQFNKKRGNECKVDTTNLNF